MVAVARLTMIVKLLVNKIKQPTTVNSKHQQQPAAAAAVLLSFIFSAKSIPRKHFDLNMVHTN